MQVQLNPPYQSLDFFFHSNRFFDALYQRDERTILSFSVEELAGAFFGPLELIVSIHQFAEEVLNRSFSSPCAYHSAFILRKMLCRSLKRENLLFYDKRGGNQLLARQLENALQSVEDTSPLCFEIIILIRMIDTAILHNNLSDHLDDVIPFDHEEEIATFDQLDVLLDLASQYLREKFEKEPIEDKAMDFEIKSEPAYEMHSESAMEAAQETIKRKDSPALDVERPAKRARRDNAESAPSGMHHRQTPQKIERTPLDAEIFRVKNILLADQEKKE